MLKKKIKNFLRNILYNNIEVLNDLTDTLYFNTFYIANFNILESQTSVNQLENYIQYIDETFLILKHDFYKSIYSPRNLYRVMFPTLYEEEAVKVIKKYTAAIDNYRQNLISNAALLLNERNQEYH